jgi:hypothetical protein
MPPSFCASSSISFAIAYSGITHWASTDMGAGYEGIPDQQAKLASECPQLAQSCQENCQGQTDKRILNRPHTRTLCQNNQGTVEFQPKPVTADDRTTYRTLSPERTSLQNGTDSPICERSLQKDGSRGSSVGIAPGYGLDDRGVGVRVPVESRIFSSPQRPDRLWGPPNLVFSGYWGLFPRSKAAWAWNSSLTSS